MHDDQHDANEHRTLPNRKSWHTPKFAELAEIADETKSHAGTIIDAGLASS